MANSLYIASIEPRSGKSVVALGIMEMLSKRVSRMGYFRPIIPTNRDPDNNIELIRQRSAVGIDRPPGVNQDITGRVADDAGLGDIPQAELGIVERVLAEADPGRQLPLHRQPVGLPGHRDPDSQGREQRSMAQRSNHDA